MLGLLAVLCFAACARDDTQARLCGLLLEPLNPDGADIRVIRTGPTAEPNTLRIDYRMEFEGRARTRTLICRFGGKGLQDGSQDLVGVVTEFGPMTESSFYLLKRFLFGRANAQAVDVVSAQRAANIPEVPFGVALTVQHMLNALPQAAVYALIASAYALIYGLVGRIVLGFGALSVIGGYAAVLALGIAVQWGVSNPATGLAIALAVAVFSGAAHGIAVGRVVVKPLLKRGGVTILIATTGLMIALDEYVRLAQGNAFRWMPPLFSTPVALLRAGAFTTTLNPIVPIVTAVALVCITALLYAMGQSRFGRAWRALADDAKAAELFGVNPKRVFLVSFAVSSGLAGVAGFITTAQYGGVGFAGGFAIGLKALIGAVLGGIGSVPGALLGGALIGVLDASWAALMPIDTREIALYALLAVVLALRPGGLFGYAEGGPRQI